MSESIDPAIVMQFGNMVEHLFQQKVERLRTHVRVKTGLRGDRAGFDLLGATNAVEITGQRDTDTVWQNPASTRRWAPKQDFDHSVLLGFQEQQEILVDLESGYARNGFMAKARKTDDLTIDAVTGTAITGQNATGTSSYSTSAPTASGGGGNQIASGSVNLTVDKMREARAVFTAREVGIDDLEAGNIDAFTMVISGSQMRSLMEETEATSVDFISEAGVRSPLVGGIIPFYMGFRLRLSAQLNLTSTDRQVIAWHRDAMGLGIWVESFPTVDRLPTKNNATGIKLMFSMGAVRIQDNGVLSIACTE